MVKKEQIPLSEPANTITIDCDIAILSIRRTTLKISPHCWKRNEDFRKSKKEKIRKNLDRYLLDKKVIGDLVQQIREEDI